jgi:NAD(P)-dependent dehydrogenase (short-subunit alcohol dehydrogenase family)
MTFSQKDIFLVTGASSGIGKAVCIDLNAQGAFVIACARNSKDIQDLKDISPYPDNFAIEELDLSNPNKDINSWLKTLVNNYGRLKGMALIAGIQNIVPVSGITQDKLEQILQINLVSNIFLSKAFIDRRINAGPGSSIVFMSSVSSKKGEGGLSMYAASKGALNSFAKSLAKEVSSKGIRVNSVLAGMIKTNLLKKWSHIYTEEYLIKLNKQYPLGLGDLDGVIGPIRFLLSEDSKWVTGTEVVVDGGSLL